MHIAGRTMFRCPECQKRPIKFRHSRQRCSAGTQARQRPGVWQARFAIARRALTSQRHEQPRFRSEEHTSELQSLMRISYAVFCLKQKKTKNIKIKNKVQQ